MEPAHLVVTWKLRSSAAALRAGWGHWLFLLLDPPHTIAAALGTHSLKVSVEQAAPLVTTAQAFEGDLFWHGDYFP
jgi:hypothetical protein